MNILVELSRMEAENRFPLKITKKFDWILLLTNSYYIKLQH